MIRCASVVLPAHANAQSRRSQGAARPFNCFNGLTLEAAVRKSNGKVTLYPTSFYARARLRNRVTAVLREESTKAPPERLLQLIWQQQRLLGDRLTTLDGRPVRVLHPGFLNLEAGPDFQGAVIRIGDNETRSGDVEIDLLAAGWRAHGHDTSPSFRNVILHVIWDGKDAGNVQIPTLALRRVLDSPVAELSAWLGGEGGRTLPESSLGKCCAPLKELPPDELTDLLRQAGQVRWRTRAAWFQARARQSGWEQAFWEGLFRALGYKQNIWPMLKLAESRPGWFSSKEKPTSEVLQARLFGLSGLLPVEVGRRDGYLRRIWDRWWREQDQFAEHRLPRSAWRFSGVRPANHPQRRLALSAHWLSAPDFLSKLEAWFVRGVPERKLVSSLNDVLQAGPDEFWSRHWTFRSARLPKPQPLIGASRATDLAMNVILPWFWVRAREGRNRELERVAEERFFAWPAAQDNSVLKLARQRLLGGASTRLLKTAALQQGLIQVVRDFCDHSNAVCDRCRFPELVREFAESGRP